jgi:Xaa-Pro aminopeptidase
MPDYTARISAARGRMEALGIDALYLSPGANAYYLTGWKRRPPTYGNIVRNGGWVEGLVLGLHGGPIFTVPRMIKDFWLLPLPDMDVRVLPDLGDPVAFLRDVFAVLGLGSGAIAVENRASAELTTGIQQARPGAPLRLASEFLAPLRMIKSEEELAIMRNAGRIVEETMDEIRRFLTPASGQTELDVAWEIDRLMVKKGATWPSFTTNVWQMGPGEERTVAQKASSRTLEYGNALLFDFGSVLDEYCYDFGRTVFLGEPPEEYERVYRLVMQAQAAGIEALRSGVNSGEAVDAIARKVIAEAGYGDFFSHRLGHGIGLDVHEPPFLDRGDATLLQEGMCFTIEPSVFIPGRLGARTEDVFVATPNGGVAMTDYDRGVLVVE